MMNNIIAQDYCVSREMQNRLKKHTSKVIWFTGLSGSGKSTLANLVEKKLFAHKVHTYALDGDNIRGGLNKNLGFSAEDRAENLRRIAEVSKLFVEAGTLVIAAFIAPLQKNRDQLKDIIGEDNFVEIFVNTSIEECERRDMKGLYKKARAGEIQNFTGISAPYEIPVNPDIIISTENETIEESVDKIISFIMPKLKLDDE
jgi:adenylylsulfate kinase